MRSHACIVLLLAIVLVVAPTSVAYKGSKLARGSIDSFTLTDQFGQPYAFDSDSEGVVVVSFIFTRCQDVCPVITQLLKSTQLELSQRQQEDVTFVSITVDPEYDSPDVLQQYTETHGVSWPHLTGTKEQLEPVWATFGLVVQTSVIQAHTKLYDPAESSLTVIDTNNSSQQHMFSMDIELATQWLAEEKGWLLNTSSQAESFLLHSINGVTAPEGEAWQLQIWNETAQQWMSMQAPYAKSNALEHPHLAWILSSANNTSLPIPPQEVAFSMSVSWPNATVETSTLREITGFHLTQGALTTADIEVEIDDSSYGHYLTSIDHQSAPSDYSWWWNLYLWNESTSEWDSSNIGMDDVQEPHHLLWAPSYLNSTSFPPPTDEIVSSDCNQHGWLMGSGSSQHCMCDTGYGWNGEDRLSCVLETTEEYMVGHSTITYILNVKREPIVAWAGDDWYPEDVAADIRELLEKEQLGGFTTQNTPSLSFIALCASIAVSTVVTYRKFNHKPLR